MTSEETPFRLSYPLTFLIRTAAFSALACGAGFLILRWLFSRDLGEEYAQAFYTLRNLLEFLLPALVFCLLAVLLTASVVVFVVAVFASHKVAGPLFRFQRVASYLQRRVLIGRIHLRVGDQGKPVADEINRWVDRRKRGFTALRAAAQECEGGLRDCERAIAAGDRAGLRAALEVCNRAAREFPRKRA